ncbi:Malate dehydrogenase, cytoplasmic, partial [Coelomomyces lativittatus]
NSTVPIFSQALKKKNVYNPAHLFGVTILDAVRSSTFVSELKNLDPRAVRVNVVGGHSGPTIVPLLSQLKLNLSQAEIEKLTHRIQYGGDEVVK